MVLARILQLPKKSENESNFGVVSVSCDGSLISITSPSQSWSRSLVIPNTPFNIKANPTQLKSFRPCETEPLQLPRLLIEIGVCPTIDDIFVYSFAASIPPRGPDTFFGLAPESVLASNSIWLLQCFQWSPRATAVRGDLNIQWSGVLLSVHLHIGYPRTAHRRQTRKVPVF